MSGYSESVIIPFFQKKISELQSVVTVLEANYLVEQQKTKELSDKVTELSNGYQAHQKDSEAQLAQTKADLAKKYNESNQLAETNAIISKRIEDLKRVIQQQDQRIVALDLKNKELETQISDLRKKRKNKEVILDGSTF